jgi:Peptidase family M23
MSTNKSLGFLVITGALLSAQAVPAYNSFSTVKTLVINNTLKANLPGINSFNNLDPVNIETPQPSQDRSQPVAHNFSSIDRNISSPSSNFQSTATTQTNTFSSDVALLDRSTRNANAAPERPEPFVEIAVPAPRTQMIKRQFIPYSPRATQNNTIPSAVAIPIAPPVANTPIPAAKPTTYTNNSGANNSSVELIYPLMNPARVTSRFGWRTHPLTGSRRFHSGLDIGAPSGAPVVASGAGFVVSAGWNGGYGKAIVIQHNDTQQTLYGHLSEISVQPGQLLTKGTVIGLVGSTGNSTGPHLHFERRMPSAAGSWVAVDPSAEIQYAVENLRRSAPFAQKDLPPGL